MAVLSSDYDVPVDPETGMPYPTRPARPAVPFREGLRRVGSMLPSDAYGWATLPAKATVAALRGLYNTLDSSAGASGRAQLGIPRADDAPQTMEEMTSTARDLAVTIAMLGYGGDAGAAAGDVVMGMGARGPKVPKKKGAVGTVFDGVTNYKEALAKALRGEHLKRTDTGKYVGAPADVTEPGHLARNRTRALQKIEDGAFNADWYDRARAIGDEVSGGDAPMASLFSRGGAANSPQNTPMNEVNDFVRQHNSMVQSGRPIRVRTDQQMNNVGRAYERPAVMGDNGGPPLDDPVITFQPQDIKLGKKTGPYGDAKDPTIPPENLYKTANDLWHGRVMGYGEDFNRAFTPQEHGFLTGENLILADRAQRTGAGAGFLPPNYEWNPRSAQAATWGAQRVAQYTKKAEANFKKKTVAALRKQEETGRAPKKMPVMRSQEDIVNAAKYGIDNAVERNTANDTMEFVTGENTGHLAGLNRADEATRNAYTQQMGDAYFRTENGRMRDPIYESMQMYQRDALPTQGVWKNSAGEIERNPGWTSRPLVGVEGSRLGINAKGDMIRGGPGITNQDASMLRMAASLRGLLTGQEASGWSKFTPANTTSKLGEKNAIRFTGTPENSTIARAALEAQGLDVVDLGDGVVAGKFGGSNGKEIAKALKNAGKFASAGDAQIGNWQNGLETIPWTKQEGTGATTRAILEKLQHNPSYGGNGVFKNVAKRLDAGRLRGSLRRMNEIDTALSVEKNLPVRKDLMRLRDMIADIGLDDVIAYVKKTGGAGLPALAAAPSLSSLLEEPASPDR